MEDEKIPGLFQPDIHAYRELLDGISRHLASHLEREYRPCGGVAVGIHPTEFPAIVMQLLNQARSSQIVNLDPRFITFQLMVRKLEPINLFEVVARSPEIAFYASGMNADYAKRIQKVLGQE